MTKSREIPMDPTKMPLIDKSRGFNFYEELMQCEPGVEPEQAVDASFAIRILVDEALESLEFFEAPEHAGRMRFVFEACVIERRSLREVGRLLQLSKTHVARVRDQAVLLLREELAQNPHIQEVLST